MKRFRWIFYSLIALLGTFLGMLLSPGSGLNRTISVALCALLSAEPTLCGVAASQTSGRVVAVNVPLVERLGSVLAQRDREFDPPVSSQEDPPPFPYDPGPDYIREDFAGESNSATQIDFTDDRPITGLWLYALYESEEGDLPIYQIPVEITQNGDEVSVSVCENDCTDGRQFLIGQDTLTPQDVSLLSEMDGLIVETVESLDGRTIWGRVEDDSAGIFFAMHKLIYSTEISILDPGENNLEQLASTKFSQDSSSERDKSASNLYTNPETLATGINPLNNFNNIFQQITSQKLSRFAANITASFRRDLAAGNNAIAERQSRTWNWRRGNNPEPVGRFLDCYGYIVPDNSYALSKSVPGRICYRAANSVSRLGGSLNMQAVKRLGRIGLRGLRFGFRIASRLSLPLLLLDVGLTAYEFCANNPDTCRSVRDRIVEAFRPRPANAQTASNDPHSITYTLRLPNWRIDSNGNCTRIGLTEVPITRQGNSLTGETRWIDDRGEVSGTRSIAGEIDQSGNFTLESSSQVRGPSFEILATGRFLSDGTIETGGLVGCGGQTADYEIIPTEGSGSSQNSEQGGDGGGGSSGRCFFSDNDCLSD